MPTKHQHRALSDEWIIEHAKWKYRAEAGSPIVELIRRLSKKPYASRVAAFWQMHCFNIAGPMTWTGEMFEGEATAFVCVSSAKGVIHVTFRNGLEDLPAVSGGIDASERVIDAYVSRILHEPAGQ